MKTSNRRTFVWRGVLASAALGSGLAHAQPTPAKLQENDPTAVALGYREDTSKVDAAKYPKHTNKQTCANCALYQGKPADPAAACPLFAGKQVAANGWCSAYSPRAG